MTADSTTADRKADQSGDRNDDQQKLHDLLEEFRAVVLITHALPEGGRTASPQTDVEVTSRPMQVARLDENCDMWFLTDADTAKVYEIRTDPMVHVVAQDGSAVFLSIRGVAKVLQDKATIRSLWSKPYEVWFPEGPDTPGIRAIHVQAHEGQYWDSKGVNRIKYIFQAAKAFVTNTTPETGGTDQHGTVRL